MPLDQPDQPDVQHSTNQPNAQHPRADEDADGKDPCADDSHADHAAGQHHPNDPGRTRPNRQLDRRELANQLIATHVAPVNEHNIFLGLYPLLTITKYYKTSSGACGGPVHSTLTHAHHRWWTKAHPTTTTTLPNYPLIVTGKQGV